MRSSLSRWQLPLIGAIASGAMACSSGSHGSTSAGITGNASSTGAVVASSSGGTTAGMGSTGGSATSGGSGTGGSAGSSTGSGTTGGTTGGGLCLPDGGSACQPSNGIPPGCWFNAKTSDQIMNGCTLAPYDQSIAPPPPAGAEDLPLYDGGELPLPSP